MQALVTFLFVIAPVLAHSATYYVAKTGNNNYSCSQAQSVSTPKLTINGGLSCMQGGDTLIIKAGTYVESIGVKAIPPSGTANKQTVIKAAPGEVAIIKPNAGNEYNDAVTIFGRSYITLDGLTIDGRRFKVGGVDPGPYSHYITVQNSVIRNTVNAGYPEFSQSCVGLVGQAGSNSHINFINNEIYNCGPDTGHGLYLHARDSLIERNRIHHVAHAGIHLYHKYSTPAANNNIIRYNEVYSNGTGMLIADGDNNLIHDNIIRSSSGNGIMLYGNSGNQINANKIYDNKKACIWIRDEASNTRVANNFCWQNANNKIVNEGTNTIISNNLFSAPLSGSATSPATTTPSAPVGLQVAP